MLNEEEFSDDTSDEDYVPQDAEKLSGDEDGMSDDNEAISDQEELDGKKRKKKKGGGKTEKKRKGNPLLAALGEEKCEDKVDDVAAVKEDLPDSKKVDDLWADFLADVDEKKEVEQKPKLTSKVSWSALLGTKKKAVEEKKEKAFSYPKSTVVSSETPKPTTVKVTKVFEFAGEEVRVEEEVAADTLQSQSSTPAESSAPANRKTSGLSNLMDMIGNKNKKLSTLEKSKLDWNNFKKSEGIEDDMQLHLKSKDGFLEKQAFLERADLKQFEIERGIRLKRSSTNRME